MKVPGLLIFLGLFLVVECDVNDNTLTQCDLPVALRNEIKSYAPTVQKIINSAINGNFRGSTYKELADFVDKFGNRRAGSQNLENAIDYMLKKSRDEEGLAVHGEEVKIPNWIRGNESAMLIEPRITNIPILGLGYSVGTPPQGIAAEVLVVKSFADLKARAAMAPGKIIVYNQDYVNYGTTVQYRSRGATEASKLGAVASLIRSISPFDMSNPHTGMQTYRDNVTKIPTACISIEDAHMLQRMQDRGETIKIVLKMGAHQLQDTFSRNSIIELKGKEQPQKVVIVSGHLDSWDVGTGAMDDGGGAFISWSSVVLLNRLQLRPRRTIRAILWTAEEFGLIGASAYKSAHVNESDNLVFIMESDEGTFNPLGLKFSAGKQGGCILTEIMALLEPLNATQAVKANSVGSDIALWTSEGFSGASLYNENEKYFWYHHSAADTMDVEDSGALDKNTALWASVAYVLADLSIDFPRENSTIP